MPLNRVQLMEVPGGPVVTGSVKAGTGLLISGDGTVSVNPATNVTQLIAGSNITLTPANGFGAVTISSNPLALYFPTQRSLSSLSAQTGGELAQGAQNVTYGTQSFNIPSGANTILVSIRMPSLTFANGSNPLAGGTIWTEGCQVTATYGGVVTGVGVVQNANTTVFSGTGVGRSQGQFLVRSDLFTMNTTSGGTLTVNVSCQQTSSIYANCLFQNLLVIVTPIKQ